MISLKDIAIISGLLAVLFGIMSVIISMLNRKRYKEICALYLKNFDSLPWATQIYDNVNSLYVKSAYGMKTDFIFRPLIWNKKSSFSKNDDKDFIRGLPQRLIRPFYIEYFITAVSFVFFITTAILVFIVTHK
ncbi:hypothetical protein ACCW92_22130 [Enterobacter soli]|uniref:hypothetical protein n=1 Tax=Enterobacter soli TaxID=885040 RepID=UPI0028655202|nr:hypothetical protein [Enterobacter soli]